MPTHRIPAASLDPTAAMHEIGPDVELDGATAYVRLRGVPCVQLDARDVARVYDEVAGAWTVHHGLDDATIERARSRAAQARAAR